MRGPFSVLDMLREWKSKDRLRYKMNGFNLDLRYITPNIIVMASPGDQSTLESNSRNNVNEVNRFFRTHHNGHVKCYNLIGEAGHDKDVHKVDAVMTKDYAFLEHAVPGLSRMQAFCNDVKSWLQMNTLNVAVIMCRSGRSRSAIMACAYLLYAWPEEFQAASDAISYFTWCRMRFGQALELPSQRRYISYFAQRFAASPQRIRMSRVFIPVRPLGMNKIRLEVFGLNVSHNTDRGDENEVNPIWSSQGKQMGKIERNQTYVIFELPDSLRLVADVKVSVSGRKYGYGGFSPLFSFWFNCGFIDHSPVVWDVSCFDHLSPYFKGHLPEDFHVQTLFVGKPRVACSLDKVTPARIYCWDCEDPFLSEEDSVLIHRSRTVIGGDGEQVQVRTGPAHRFHPLVEEDCAICKHRHQRYEKGVLGAEIMETFETLDPVDRDRLDSANAMEYLKKTIDADIKKPHFQSGNADVAGVASDSQEAYNLLKNEKAQRAKGREREILYFAGKLHDDSKRPPLFGIPTVFCQDTNQFLCAWCNKHALREKDRKSLTRYAIPLVQSSALRYSGCARQQC